MRKLSIDYTIINCLVRKWHKQFYTTGKIFNIHSGLFIKYLLHREIFCLSDCVRGTASKIKNIYYMNFKSYNIVVMFVMWTWKLKLLGFVLSNLIFVYDIFLGFRIHGLLKVKSCFVLYKYWVWYLEVYLKLLYNSNSWVFKYLWINLFLKPLD